MHFPVNENVIFVDKNEKTWLSIKLNEILSEFNLLEIVIFCKKKKKKDKTDCRFRLSDQWQSSEKLFTFIFY